ncbi:hypothetical protein B6U99_03475 [Candidatus Geothermarchaeota archaeon ex4572_27]|nr:MAG: hypothetical protein B6U99_03475 [Candidatus Geothermarchaeota archaeon ex4572_27]
MMTPLDAVDRRLLAYLMDDGRLSLSKLGRALGMSHVAVGKRLERLVKGGVVRVQANLGLKRLGLRLVAVLMEVDGVEALERLKHVFSECPRMLMLATLIAGFNLLGLMVAEGDDVLESITTCCAVRDYPGIKRTEVYLIGELVKPGYLPLRLAERRGGRAPCGRECRLCSRFKGGRCPGCPAVEGYRGPL